MSCDIVIVENHAVLRAALSAWIEALFPECTLIQSGYGDETLELVRDCSDLIVITSANLPDMSGIEMARRLSERCANAQVIVIAIQEGPNCRTEALNVGAVAYIPKHRVATDLIPTLRQLVPISYASQEAY